MDNPPPAKRIKTADRTSTKDHARAPQYFFPNNTNNGAPPIYAPQQSTPAAPAVPPIAAARHNLYRDPNLSTAVLLNIAEWGPYEIDRRLKESANYLVEWRLLIAKTEKLEPVKVRKEDIARHVYLKKKLHENLGLLAKLVQIQLKRHKAAGAQQGNGKSQAVPAYGSSQSVYPSSGAYPLQHGIPQQVAQYQQQMGQQQQRQHSGQMQGYSGPAAYMNSYAGGGQGGYFGPSQPYNVPAATGSHQNGTDAGGMSSSNPSLVSHPQPQSQRSSTGSFGAVGAMQYGYAPVAAQQLQQQQQQQVYQPQSRGQGQAPAQEAQPLDGYGSAYGSNYMAMKQQMVTQAAYMGQVPPQQQGQQHLGRSQQQQAQKQPKQKLQQQQQQQLKQIQQLQQQQKLQQLGQLQQSQKLSKSSVPSSSLSTNAVSSSNAQPQSSGMFNPGVQTVGAVEVGGGTAAESGYPNGAGYAYVPPQQGSQPYPSSSAPPVNPTGNGAVQNYYAHNNIGNSNMNYQPQPQPMQQHQQLQQQQQTSLHSRPSKSGQQNPNQVNPASQNFSHIHYPSQYAPTNGGLSYLNPIGGSAGESASLSSRSSAGGQGVGGGGVTGGGFTGAGTMPSLVVPPGYSQHHGNPVRQQQANVNMNMNTSAANMPPTATAAANHQYNAMYSVNGNNNNHHRINQMPSGTTNSGTEGSQQQQQGAASGGMPARGLNSSVSSSSISSNHSSSSVDAGDDGGGSGGRPIHQQQPPSQQQQQQQQQLIPPSQMMVNGVQYVGQSSSAGTFKPSS